MLNSAALPAANKTIADQLRVSFLKVPFLGWLDKGKPPPPPPHFLGSDISKTRSFAHEADSTCVSRLIYEDGLAKLLELRCHDLNATIGSARETSCPNPPFYFIHRNPVEGDKNSRLQAMTWRDW